MHFFVTSTLKVTVNRLENLEIERWATMKNLELLNVLSSDECGIDYTLAKIGGKWNPFILWFLAKNGVKRYGEIRRFIPKVADKMLSQQLKELAADDLIKRKDYQTIPPKVEYAITEEGMTLMPILDLMCAWGFERKK